VSTIVASTNSGLLSALKSASSGDVIKLAGGTYSVSISNIDKDVTITTSAGAVFSRLKVSNSSGLTFDNVDFNAATGVQPITVRASDGITISNGDLEGVASGQGAGRGLWVSASTDFTVENMTIHGWETGLSAANVQGLTFRGNTFTNISNDAIIAGNLAGATIAGNDIDLAVPSGHRHSDGIQMWNNPPNSPSSNVVIEDNVIHTHNNWSHGIYMANAVANGGGGASSFYQHVTIEGNTVVAGDGLGLSWGQTNHLDIRENIIIKDPALLPEKSIPSIRVAWQSTDVHITHNVVEKASQAADSAWQQVGKTGSAWEVDDKIISVGSSLKAAQSAKAAMLGGEQPPGDDGNGGGTGSDGPNIGTSGADVFRFDATGDKDYVRDVDFSGGDKLVLHDYAAGTFKGGSAVGASADGTSVTIDSLADLDAVRSASPNVRVHEGVDDTIAIMIKQSSDVHEVRLVGLAHDFF
jgi:hypothetical protein